MVEDLGLAGTENHGRLSSMWYDSAFLYSISSSRKFMIYYRCLRSVLTRRGVRPMDLSHITALHLRAVHSFILRGLLLLFRL
jgi:hypothetical protein